MILEPAIQSERLVLRTMSATDASPAYRDWMNDPRVNRFLESRFKALAIEDLVSFITTCNDDPRIVLLAITARDDGRHFGNIKLGPIDHNHKLAEIGLVVGLERDWGRGYAREAIGALVEAAFTRLGLHKVTAGCYAENKGSLKAFLACGFEVEGVRRAHCRSGDVWDDVILLGRVAPG